MREVAESASQLPSWQHIPQDKGRKASDNDGVSPSISMLTAIRLKNIVSLIRRDKFSRDTETKKIKRSPR